MTRWLKKRRLWFWELRRNPVWSEPALPPYVKFNPEGVNPEPGELQPGDISMAKAAEEFLAEDEPGEMNGDLHLRPGARDHRDRCNPTDAACAPGARTKRSSGGSGSLKLATKSDHNAS